MDIADIFGSRFLNASDFTPTPITCTIDAVSTEVMENNKGQEQQKLILHLSGQEKPCICNSTNAHKLAQKFGTCVDTWPGSTIQVRTHKVRMGNRYVDGIDMIPVATAPGQVARPEAVKTQPALHQGRPDQGAPPNTDIGDRF